MQIPSTHKESSLVSPFFKGFSFMLPDRVYIERDYLAPYSSVRFLEVFPPILKDRVLILLMIGR